MKYSSGLVFGLTLLLSGCGGEMQEFREALAANWGVKEKNRKITQKDLGKNYRGLKGTHFDFFSKKAPKKRRVKITYHTYGLKPLDRFNRESNILFAKYRYTDGLVDMFLADARKIVKKDMRRMSIHSINRTLRAQKVKNTSRKSVRNYRKVRKDFRRVLRSYKRVGRDAKKLSKLGIKLLKALPAELKKDRRRAIFADKMAHELKRSIKRLGQIVGATPDLSKRIVKLNKFITALDRVK